MKNTPENKAKFFAHYWGQKVLRFKNLQTEEIHPSTTIVDAFSTVDIKRYPDWFLELKPLSQITDEDAIEVTRLLYGFSHTELVFGVKESYRKEEFNYGFIQILVGDFLRSKGYALPYMGISVEQQIERGWVKLTTK